MRTVYNRPLNSILTIDENERVRCILPLRPEASGKRNPRAAAEAFIRGAAEAVRFAPAGRDRMQRRVSFIEPREQGVEYHLADEKPLFDLTTIGFWQTALNTPVWNAGLSATVKQGPHRVVGAVDNSRDHVEAKLPSPDAIERYRRLFEAGAPPDGRWRPSAPPPAATAAEASSFLAGLLHLDVGRVEPDAAPRLVRGRFFIYRYVADERTSASDAGHEGEPPQASGHAPTLPLPPVPDHVAEGRDYLVAEITFTLPVQGFTRLDWRMMVEVESGAVLYLRPLTAGMNGFVFLADPITASGDPGMGPTQPDAVLDPWRDDVPINNLDGSGYLSGTYAALSDFSAPFISAPAVGNLDFSARTDEFAAVNAYYHTDRFFQMVEDMGIPVSVYFSHTVFPVPVDHRSTLGPGNNPSTTVGAMCHGSGTDGIKKVEFALAYPGVQNGPMGIACDWRIVLHELGGHGVLYEHVKSASFAFAHSAGDSFAVILNDPDSAWHSTPGSQIDRCLVSPFVPIVTRRCDRDPTVGGWGWGGWQDDSKSKSKLNEKRNSEEMLSSCLFRIYRAIGGDSQDLSSRRFAAWMCTYLILSAINTLNQYTNPDTPEKFAAAMLTADTGDWILEGIFGGAYGKVIRWSFEMQGAFRVDFPTTSSGDPPDVDVYIDDGRAGEYSYQPVYWNTTAIWNRRSPDNGTTHQKPLLGATNYAYVYVRNRGKLPAQNVVVRGFHCEPSLGMIWPDDLQPLTTPQLTVSSPVPPSWGNFTTATDVLVGPFPWTPFAHAGGQDCLVMVVSEAGDPSNADLFTAGRAIPDWRLVPYDNNIAMRRVFPVTKWYQIKELAQMFPWAVNTSSNAVAMVIRVRMPELMERRGWKIDFEGDGPEFRMEPRERRRMTVRVTPGAPFTDADIEAASDRDIVVTAHADGVLIGGMTYRLEPEATRAGDGPRPWWKNWVRWILSRLKSRGM